MSINYLDGGPMRKVLNTAGFERLEVTSAQETCETCVRPLWVTQHRERPLQTMDQHLVVVMRDKTCRTVGCPGVDSIVRPPQEGLIPTVRGCGYGLDVIAYVGQQRIAGGRSLPEVHAALEEKGVRISERHVSNLLRVYLALVEVLPLMILGHLRRIVADH
jgi:hypothetical protein